MVTIMATAMAIYISQSMISAMKGDTNGMG
jgi:hypothetical protein